MKFKVKPKMSIWRYLALGYLTVILLGSVLLVLPFSSRDGGASYLDALFTATSAACVTGLVPFDTALHWSGFGQAVILILIQLGGLGFTTFVSVIFLLVKRGMGLYSRSVMIQSVGGNRLAGVKTLIRRILIGTFSIELLGAALLSIRFIPEFGGAKGTYFAIFHSVSAYCNAGFDVMGSVCGESASLTHYAGDPLVSLVICVLIIVGGLGFCLWGDVFDCKGNPKKFQFYTKVILVVNTALLVISTLLFLLFERNASCAEFGFGKKLLCSFFDATTARTAGFSSTDPTTLSESGYFLTVFLMLIGGSSGSTAGGIKVGTFTVIVAGIGASLRGKRDVTIGKRRIDSALVGQALAIFIAYLALIFISTMVICAVQSEFTFSQTLFETVSALGTVGISVLTAPRGVVCKLVLIVLMYLGRVGVLTFAFALRRKRTTDEIRRPIESFYIG